MDKTEYRAVIKFFVKESLTPNKIHSKLVKVYGDSSLSFSTIKEGLTPNEIHSKFIKVYGDSSLSFSTIKKWAAEFKLGRTSLEDDPREGRPESATTPEIIEQVHDMV